MMRASCIFFAATLPAVFAVGITQNDRQFTTSEDSAVKLPGAARVIDASQFPSLQAALNAVPPTGGSLILPAGSFKIHEPLRISAEDVSITGAGTATHIENVNTQGQPAFVIRPPKDKKTIWRVRLANLRLTGNPESGNGLELHHVDEAFLDGITVSYHGGHGIWMDHCYEDPRICNSLITYNKQTGLALDGCHDIVVAANQFEENRDALTCSDGFNLCMTGNCLDDHLRHGVVIENTYGSVVSGNMIEECQGTAIILDRNCYGITISANVIAHNFGGGVDLRDAHGCAVSANTFTIVPRKALVVGPKSGRITVSGNNFSDSYIGGQEKRRADDQAASGVLLQGTTEINISGNLFSGLDGPAIASGDSTSSRLLIGNNVLIQESALISTWEQSQLSHNLVIPER